MITRRNALAVLPAGVLLEADFQTVAQAQPVPQYTPPDVLKPTVTKEVIVTELEKFVAEAGKRGGRFSSQLAATKSILDVLDKLLKEEPILGSNPAATSVNFKNYVTAINTMISSVDVVVGNYLSREDTTQQDDFIRSALNRIKAPAEPLEARKRWQRLGLREPLSISDKQAKRQYIETNSNEIVRVLSARINVYQDEAGFPKPALSGLAATTTVYELLLNSKPTDSSNIVALQTFYKPRLNAIAENLLQAGFDLARSGVLEFYAAPQVYAIYHFILGNFLKEPLPKDTTYIENRRLARTRTVGILATIYDFYNDALGDRRLRLAILRGMIDRFPKRAFLGGSAFHERKAPDFNDVVLYKNYYLDLKRAQPLAGVPEWAMFGVVESAPPYYFESTEILPTIVLEERQDSKLNEKNWSGYRLVPPASESIFEMPGYPPKTGNEKEDFNEARDGIISKLNEKIRQVRREYTNIQLEYNCAERMSWGLLEMFGKG
jgi:hypothetical protein